MYSIFHVWWLNTVNNVLSLKKLVYLARFWGNDDWVHIYTVMTKTSSYTVNTTILAKPTQEIPFQGLYSALPIREMVNQSNPNY